MSARACVRIETGGQEDREVKIVPRLTLKPLNLMISIPTVHVPLHFQQNTSNNPSVDSLPLIRTSLRSVDYHITASLTPNMMAPAGTPLDEKNREGVSITDTNLTIQAFLPAVSQSVLR